MQAIKVLLKGSLERMGLYVRYYRNLPAGVDWLLDVRRNLRLPAEPIVFDVGANAGQTVREIRRGLPEARVHAFEPTGASFDRLVESTRRLNRVSCHRLALGAEPCTRTVRVSPGSKCNSLVGDRFADDADAAAERIEVTTVADFCASRGIERIDILKTDTEGFDGEVLRGAEPLLEAGAIDAVYVELGFSRDNAKNTPFQPVFEFLTDRGFRLAGLYELGWFQRKPWPTAWCNALFFREAVAGPNRGDAPAGRADRARAASEAETPAMSP